MWKSYSGRQKCHTKVLRHDFWRSCFVFGSCVLRSKCNSPTFMRVKSLQDGKRFAQKAPLCATHPSRGGAFHGTRLPAAVSFPPLPKYLPKFRFWHQTLIHSSDLGRIYLWLTTWLMLFRLAWYDSDQCREGRMVQFTFQINIISMKAVQHAVF